MKILKILPLALVMTLLSCENESLLEQEPEQNTENQNDMQMPTGIYAMSINNGVTSACTNNILVFPDMETFKQTAQMLDDQWEANIDAVQPTDPEITDEEYEEYLNTIGFNEDQPYVDFEEAYLFCSLRSDIVTKELAWLSRRTDTEDWNEAILTDPDPDNHYVDDKYRPLLNAQSEVIIKDSLNNNVIYKLYEGGWVEIRNNDYEELAEFNTNGIPENPESSKFNPYVGEVIAYDPSNPWDGFPGYTGDYGSCRHDEKHVKYYFAAQGKRIKATLKITSAVANVFEDYQIKAKTKHYNDWGVDWVPGPSRIEAGIHSNYRMTCDNELPPYPYRGENKYATKVKKVMEYPQELTEKPEIRLNNAYGTHKRRSNFTKVLDFFNGQP